jgi:hypothetical protein
MIPSRHDFRGGSITAEQHTWRLADPDFTTSNNLGARRVWANHKPLQTVTDFKVKFTNTYEVSIDPANLYVNHIEGWAEVVSLAAIVTGIYPVGINFGLYTPIAEVSYTYGYDFESTGEYLEPTDAGVYRSANCWWNSAHVPKVYRDGVLQSSGYTINYDEGTVIFTSLAGSDVTADYHYKMPSAVGEATGLIVSQIFGERDLVRRGMSGIGLMRVAEVEMRRAMVTSHGAVVQGITPEAMALLDAYVFRTVR